MKRKQKLARLHGEQHTALHVAKHVRTITCKTKVRKEESVTVYMRRYWLTLAKEDISRFPRPMMKHTLRWLEDSLGKIFQSNRAFSRKKSQRNMDNEVARIKFTASRRGILSSTRDSFSSSLLLRLW